MVIVMNEFQFKGARWWKFDFHTHTHASDDVRKENMSLSHEDWLKAFMDEGIDCVAITDHNSGEWIDDLKRVLKDIESNPPEWYKPLYLFPSVEIGASEGVHILAIFGKDKGESDIDQLLGAAGYRDTKGKSGGLSSKSTTEVIDKIVEFGGIPIPAHVDQPKGLFEQLDGSPLEQVLRNDNIYAVELRDCNYPKPQVYVNEKLQWAEIIGSDVHDFSQDSFGTFTWIKMDEPSIEGLRLALQDSNVSVNRNMNDNPNKLLTCFIEKLEITNAKYIGRAKTLDCCFSQFLNTIIGGRGTGKSTLLEFIRLVMSRNESNDIPGPLVEDSRKYFTSDESDSLLLTETEISLSYWKNNICYRLNWYQKEGCSLLEQKKDDGAWEQVDGDIRSMFPAYIYSQKQIFELARNPRSIIDIIDEAPEVNAEKLKTERRDLVNQYKQIESEQQGLNDKIAEKNRLRGELNDHARQIEQIEKSGHEEVMQKYRLRKQQLNEIENLEKKWNEVRDHLFESQENIVPSDFNTEIFSEHRDILSDLQETNDKLKTIHNKLNDLVKEAESILTEWQTEKNTSEWMQALNTEMAQYNQLHSDLEQQGIDPDRYPSLLNQHKNVQHELDLISKYQSRQQVLETDKKEVFEQIMGKRRELTENRRKFLDAVLKGNQFVSIEVQPFGENWSSIEKEIREILQCPDRFIPDFEDLKKIYQKSEDKKIEKLKETIEGIRKGDESAKYKSFTTRLQKLSPESMIDLSLWFPEDKLKITLLSTNNKPNKPLESGSPGEKAAALLAFILSYGDEPLLLDQPEDDLDNELISDLIVQQLRQTRTKRQVIIVTHNANIVVNGDAELVLPLEIVEGQTYVQNPASIQKKDIREAICNILEGGEKAFEQRYKRIHLGD